jgi:hypothetical protein
MAGNALRKERTAHIYRRGGPDFLREWLLEGRTIKSLAAEMGMARGSLRNLILKDPELTKAVDEARRHAADAHFEDTFELLDEVDERRKREIFEALDENSTRDASEANVSQIDLGLLKQKIGQKNLAAANYNPERYGGKAQQQININIGDFHLDALRKVKVIDHE